MICNFIINKKYSLSNRLPSLKTNNVGMRMCVRAMHIIQWGRCFSLIAMGGLYFCK